MSIRQSINRANRNARLAGVPVSLLSRVTKLGYATWHVISDAGGPIGHHCIGSTHDCAIHCYTGRGKSALASNRVIALARAEWFTAHCVNNTAGRQIMADAILTTFAGQRVPTFRMFSSGDFASVRHVQAWTDILTRVRAIEPRMQVWLPTRSWRNRHAMAALTDMRDTLGDSVTIRLSASGLDTIDMPAGWKASVILSATAMKPARGQVVCGAVARHGCGDCRACVSHKVEVIGYPIH